MKAYSKQASHRHGVSVITCTNRQRYLKNLIYNYTRQRHPNKELVIVINDSRIPLAPYVELAGKHSDIRMFQLPEHYSLGTCLNYAVKQTNFHYIAKFDDDDYYAPHYLTDSLLAFRKSKADVIGKKAHYMYLRGAKQLILRFPRAEHRTVGRLPGATLVFKRDVFRRVQFPDKSIGEDDIFCFRAKKKGYKVYSAGKYNFVAIRRKNSSGHTWIISDRELLAYHKKIPFVRNYKKFVRRTPSGLRT